MATKEENDASSVVSVYTDQSKLDAAGESQAKQDATALGPVNQTKQDSTQAERPPASARPPSVAFRKLFRFADRLDCALLSLAMTCAVGSGVVMPLVSLILAELLNGVSDTASYADKVNTAALYMTLVSVGAFIFLGGGAGLSFISSQRQAHRLRKAYLRALLRQDIGYADTNSLPEQAARLAEDTISIQSGIGDKLFLIVAGTAQFVGSLVLAFTLSNSTWMLALTLLAAIPFTIGAIAGLASIMTDMNGEVDDAYARAGEVLAETLGPLFRTVVALGGEEHQAAVYDRHLAEAERVNTRKGLTTGASGGVFSFTMCFLYAIGMLAGAGYIRLNRQQHPECGSGDPFGPDCLNGGNVTACLFAIVGSAFALGIVVPNITYVAGAQAAAARIFAVIDRVPPSDPYSTEGFVPPPGAVVSMRIVFDRVSFAYPSRPGEVVLKDFCLTIEPGQRLALVGPSGSGKVRKTPFIT